jgi:hypothetical protein
MKISFVIVDDKPFVRYLNEGNIDEIALNIKIEIKDGVVVNEKEVRHLFNKTASLLLSYAAKGVPLTNEDRKVIQEQLFHADS